MVSAQAVRLGWSFFGPLIDRMLAAMGSFTEPELHTVARFLRSMAGAAPRAGRV